MIFKKKNLCLGALVALGADVDTEDACKSTPLHMAAAAGHDEVWLSLLLLGASLTRSSRPHILGA